MKSLPSIWERYTSTSQGESTAIARLRAAGYRLVSGDTGGVWLVGSHGSTWYPSWRVAYAAVKKGTAALSKLKAKARR